VEDLTSVSYLFAVSITEWLTSLDFSRLQIPVPLALAVVATLGYIFGRQNRNPANAVVEQSRRELRRARLVAQELERIALAVRKDLSAHQASLNRFKERVRRLNPDQMEAAWKDLCGEAEAVLKPTLKLAGQVADAYEQIRQQTAHLMTFTELRTDPLTGVSNRRALDETLANQFAMKNRYGKKFSVALFDIDHFKRVNDELGHIQGDRILQSTARAIDDAIRETDVLARYGGEEFLVILPETDLAGACIFAERVRASIAEHLPITVSGGVAAAGDGDESETLVARADAALYQAKTAGRNLIYQHTGTGIEAVSAPATEATAPQA
jgi:diguanylate cyclase (GGDEF)-like protein